MYILISCIFVFYMYIIIQDVKTGNIFCNIWYSKGIVFYICYMEYLFEDLKVYFVPLFGLEQTLNDFFHSL